MRMDNLEKEDIMIMKDDGVALIIEVTSLEEPYFTYKKLYIGLLNDETIVGQGKLFELDGYKFYDKTIIETTMKSTYTQGWDDTKIAATFDKVAGMKLIRGEGENDCVFFDYRILNPDERTGIVVDRL